MENKQNPKPEDYGTLGIDCASPSYAVEVTYEQNAFPMPNGKHRWSYKCYNPETKETSEVQYTEWIYD